MKKFIITVDTEGDSLWGKNTSDEVTAENSKYIPQFQNLCEHFGFKPVYLTNYEMAQNAYFTDFIARKAEQGLCEIGMHLHAWNMPGAQPLTARINSNPGLPYLIEYPDEVMEEKIATMTELIQSRFGIRPTTHRAGRWAMDERYFSLIHRYGYTIDCSVTPHENWGTSPGFSEGSCGSNYSKSSELPYIVREEPGRTALYEVPMTIRENVRYFYRPQKLSATELKHTVRCALVGTKTWMRILSEDIGAQKRLIQKDGADYLMFMLHSSELMSGNHYFKTEDDMKEFYKNMETLFCEASKDREGITLREYRKLLDKRG